MDSKIDLRINAKRIRKTLDINELSTNAVKQIRMTEIYKNAENVLLFYPMKYEINLLELMSDNKNFYLPKVCEDVLLICPFKKDDMLVKSEFKVCEPCSNPVSSDILDLVIVPALMADKDGYRLGYGGGFYDRFLSANSKLKAILPIAKELFVEELPHEKYDVPIEYVIAC